MCDKRIIQPLCSNWYKIVTHLD
uniref:Uncharacterized protein n=1 Tax=Anguilla anguilla TaxID=7936 RepID=A0A0E9WC48_ANGAN